MRRVVLRMCVIHDLTRRMLPSVHLHEEIRGDDTSDRYQLYEIHNIADASKLCNKEDIYSYSINVDGCDVAKSYLVRYSLPTLCERYFYELMSTYRISGLENVNKISTLLLAISQSEHLQCTVHTVSRPRVFVIEPHDYLNIGHSIMFSVSLELL